MDYSNLAVIYNPTSGRVKNSAKWDSIRGFLPKSTRFVGTTGPGDGVRLAKELAEEGISIIAAAGGDGTVHEVANGILDSGKDPAFAVLPLGSGNDYARLLQIPFTPKEMVRKLCSTPAVAVDVGRIETDTAPPRWFINSCSLGLGGAVTFESRKISYLRGVPLYGLAAIRAIQKHFHSLPITLTVDGNQTSTHLLYMAIALGRAEGGGFQIAPTALLDDGKLDILHATKLSRLGALGYLPRMVLNLLPAGDEVIRRYQSSEIRVQSEVGMAVHSDGEILATPIQGAKDIRVKLFPKRLRVIGTPPMVSRNH